jgi:hypothetical protein
LRPVQMILTKCQRKTKMKTSLKDWPKVCDRI